MAKEIFSNNARGVLAEDLRKGYGVLTLVDDGSVNSFAHSQRGWIDPAEGLFQRATLISPDGGMEIVYITEIDGLDLYIQRAIEDTIIQAFPAGSVIEGRVTAGMLSEFAKNGKILEHASADYFAENNKNVFYVNGMQPAPPTRGLSTIGYSNQKASPAAGRVSIHRTINVALGTLMGFYDAGGQLPPGAVFSHPDNPNTQLMFESMSGKYHPYLDDLPGDVMTAGDGDSIEVFVGNSIHYIIASAYPTEMTMRMPVSFAISEIGFVCIQADGNKTVNPKVSVTGTPIEGAGNRTLVDEEEITADLERGSVYKFDVDLKSQVLWDALEFQVTQNADCSITGFFYVIAAPFEF